MTATPFLTALQSAVSDLRATVRAEMVPLDVALLNQRPDPTSWSILECLEHLNQYSRYYLPALAQALAATSRPADPLAPVGYTWMGRKSVALMHPANAKKQTTLKRLNPLGRPLDLAVLTEFDQHQARLLELLATAHTADLNHKAVPVEFFRLLKLRLGEALEFVVVHQQRHVQQAQRVRATLWPALAC